MESAMHGRCNVRPRSYSYLPSCWALPLPPGWYLFPIPLRVGRCVGGRLHTKMVYYFAHGSGCEVLWWVCLYVCLSVCLSVREHMSGTTCTIFTKFLCMLPMTVARSSSGMMTIGRIAYRREGGERVHSVGAV